MTRPQRPHRPQRHFALVALTFSLALPSCSSGKSIPLPAPENRLQSEHLPTPFSAEQIRLGSPADCVLTFRMEAIGKADSSMRMRFYEPTEQSTRFEISMLDLEGKLIGEPRNSSSTWAGLQSHASFPSARTELTRERHSFPLGSPECLLYTVTLEQDGWHKVSRFWFDPERPGPPIEMTEIVNGVFSSRMLLVDESGR
ncbi:MAG: hypothetical protein ACI8QC_002203 [Planctomycetota bacterium]|jgi:hypothetical protein